MQDLLFGAAFWLFELLLMVGVLALVIALLFLGYKTASAFWDGLHGR